MPEDVTVNAALGIIEVHSYGDITEEILNATIEKIIELEKETSINKVLVDTIGQNSMPSTVSLYQFSSNIPRLFKYAIVISKEQSTKQAQDFVETVAQNRGYMIQEFISKEEAIEWLKD